MKDKLDEKAEIRMKETIDFLQAGIFRKVNNHHFVQLGEKS